jgi:hypothetical protein
MRCLDESQASQIAGTPRIMQAAAGMARSEVGGTKAKGEVRGRQLEAKGSEALRGDWRRERDSNPRAPFEANGFQDRRFQPLTHPSWSLV